MTNVEALERLRARGYRVTLDGIAGPAPSDDNALARWLELHWPGIERTLRAEQHPTVRNALEILPGARLTDVRKVAK